MISLNMCFISVLLPSPNPSPTPVYLPHCGSGSLLDLARIFNLFEEYTASDYFCSYCFFLLLLGFQAQMCWRFYPCLRCHFNSFLYFYSSVLTRFLYRYFPLIHNFYFENPPFLLCLIYWNQDCWEQYQ